MFMKLCAAGWSRKRPKQLPRGWLKIRRIVPIPQNKEVI